MYNSSFNLLSEPWIPCAWLDGGMTSLGIRETLANAHAIREIVDQSPLVTASLHRLLLAIVHRTIQGPANTRDWASLWSSRAFHIPAFDRYFATCRARFDLFDGAHPFYQWPGLDPDCAVPVAKLT